MTASGRGEYRSSTYDRIAHTAMGAQGQIVVEHERRNPARIGEVMPAAQRTRYRSRSPSTRWSWTACARRWEELIGSKEIRRSLTFKADGNLTLNKSRPHAQSGELLYETKEG
jgi:hypothetical protein